VLRVILLVVMALLIVRAFGRLFGGVTAGARGGPRGGAPAPVKMMQDPVCGTFVVPGKALSLTAGGSTHWFCSERCRAEFASRS
jgi:YHS domain-containing protein